MTERDSNTSTLPEQSLKGRLRVGIHNFMMQLGESYPPPFTIPTLRQVRFVVAISMITTALASIAPEKAQGLVVLAGFASAVGTPIVSDLYRRSYAFYNQQS